MKQNNSKHEIEPLHHCIEETLLPPKTNQKKNAHPHPMLEVRTLIARAIWGSTQFYFLSLMQFAHALN